MTPKEWNDWLDTDTHPATSGLTYTNAKESKWELKLNVPPMGSLVIHVVEDVENPKSLLDLVSLSLSS